MIRGSLTMVMRMVVTQSLWYVLSGLCSNSPFVGNLVILEHGVRITLGRIVDVWVIQEVLNT